MAMIGSTSELRSKRRIVQMLMVSVSGLCTLALPQVAHAADPAVATTPDTTNTGGEILVTARKEKESLQEVPVTVSVVDKKTISEYHIEHVADVAERVPTLQVQVGGSGSGGSLTLRGIGSSAISAAFDSAVAFDYDGVQVSTMRMVQVGFFDTQQVEVLKGPQSLYFGKSASGGVLAINSADPTRTWEAEARASYEFAEHGTLFGGHVSGPLTDTLGIRVAAQYNDITHYVELDPTTPAVNKNRGLKDFVGRLTLAWDPSPNFTANFKFQYTGSTNNGAIAQSAIDCGPNGQPDPVWLFSGAVVFPAGYGCNSNNGKYYLPDTTPALAASVPKPSAAVGYNGVPFGYTDLYFARLKMEYKFSDTLKLTSTSGFVDLNAQDVDNYSYGGVGPAYSPVAAALGMTSAAFFAANFPALAATNGVGIPGGVGTSDPVNKLQQYTQELRLTSNFKGPINFMLGAYYENRWIEFRTSQNAVNISLIAPDPVTGYTWDYTKDQITKASADSFFGSLSYKPTDQIELSGGVRYTNEVKRSDIDIPYMHAFLVAAGFAPSGFNSGEIRFQDSNWSPEVTLKYKPAPNFNIFASLKTGFKSGGIDNSALPSNQLLGFGSSDPAVRAATAAGLIFRSEKAKGGEIGFKSELADRTVTLNATAFYYVINGLQVQNFNPQTVQFETLNAGQATTAGLDVETKWRTPVPGLMFSGNLTYLDAKYTADFITPGPDGVLGTADDINLHGRALANAPHWSGNVAFDYVAEVGGGLKLGLGGNVKYSGSYFTNNATFTDYVQNPFATVDARISIGPDNDRWSLAVVGTDINGKIYTINSGGRPFLAPANTLGVPVGDDIILNQNQGRQVFLEAKLRF